MTDADVERISDEAYRAAEQTSPVQTCGESLSCRSEEAEVWACAYRTALSWDWH